MKIPKLITLVLGLLLVAITGYGQGSTDLFVQGLPQTATTNNIIPDGVIFPITTANGGACNAGVSRSVTIQINPTGTVSGGTINFEGSNDGVNFTAVTLLDLTNLSAASVSTFTPATGTIRYFWGPLPMRFFRARIAGAITGGGSVQSVTRFLSVSLYSAIKASGGSDGTVTSVGLTIGGFTVTGSPVINSGTLAATLASPVANGIVVSDSSGNLSASTATMVSGNTLKFAGTSMIADDTTGTLLLTPGTGKKTLLQGSNAGTNAETVNSSASGNSGLDFYNSSGVFQGTIGYGNASAASHAGQFFINAITGSAIHFSVNTSDVSVLSVAAASTPIALYNGTWFTSGGTGTTTWPALLVQPSGTTSTTWSTAGTAIGVNAANGFTGNLLDTQINGTSQFSVNQFGTLNIAGSYQTVSGHVQTQNGTATTPGYVYASALTTGTYWANPGVGFSVAATSVGTATAAGWSFTGTAASGTTIYNFTNTSSASGVNAIGGFLAPNLPTGSGVYLSLGVANSTNNWASFGFANVGAGSTSNAFTLGFNGGTALESLTASGTLTLNGAVTSSNSGTGTLVIASNGGVGVGGDIYTGGAIHDGATFQHAGLTRTTAPFTATSNTALTNVTGLSVSVSTGQSYKFTAYLPTTATTSGGVQAAIGGTATATTITYEGVMFQPVTGLVNQTRAAAMGAAVCSSATTTTGWMQIIGCITVNAGGTLTVEFAQNTSNAAASTVLADATFEVVQTIN